MNSYAPVYDVDIIPATVAASIANISGIGSLFCNQPSASTPGMQHTTMRSYEVIEIGKTYGQIADNLLGVFDRTSVTFENFMTSFYDELLVNQQSLGKEFEDALYEDLWSLYVRS